MAGISDLIGGALGKITGRSGGPNQLTQDPRSPGQSVLDLFKRGLGGIAGSQGGLGGFVESQGGLGGGGLSRLQQSEINDALSQVNTGDFYEVAPGWKAWRGVSGADILSQKMSARNKGLLSAEKKEEEARIKKEDRAIKKEAAIEDRAIRAEDRAAKAEDRALNKRKVRVQERRVKVQELDLQRLLLRGILAPTESQSGKARDTATAFGKIAKSLIKKFPNTEKMEEFTEKFMELLTDNELNKEEGRKYLDVKEPMMRMQILHLALKKIGLTPELENLPVPANTLPSEINATNDVPDYHPAATSTASRPPGTSITIDGQPTKPIRWNARSTPPPMSVESSIGKK